MNFTYASLDPVPVTKPGPHAAAELRTHQGIPSMEHTAKGRLFAVWYAGGTTECRDNYVMMVVSDDDGKTWSDAVAVVDPPHPDVRAFDSNLWIAPNGKFFWIWGQGCGGESGSWDVWDGIVGTWISELENPDDDPANFRFTPPRRISNGVMMDKPTVLSDGTWAFPCSVWTGDKYRKHESLNVVQGAWMVVSTDEGKSFQYRGFVDMHNIEGGANATFDEHIYVEHSDGSITCYMRVHTGVAISRSYDKGYTWTKPVLSDIKGPDSRFFVRRLQSGNLLLVNNDSNTKRAKMTAWLSKDDGKTWPYALTLDPVDHDVAYPDGKQAEDGSIYIIHDFARRAGGYVFMHRITEDDIMAGKLVTPTSWLRRLVGESKPV
ncbi:MAG: exo-alpha-sialidase [Victivallales bacterium]|nr:exo-alpha-sialidase [Victivallales bacterium]